jgi:hypothetical protein
MARGGRGDSDVDDTYVQLLPALISSERAYNAPKAQEACQPGGVPYETFRAYHACVPLSVRRGAAPLRYMPAQQSAPS